ncbi:unnamed protein product [Arabidopsis lyrata]|nr:unnamed protein product [Arabidopsis lyrata]
MQRTAEDAARTIKTKSHHLGFDQVTFVPKLVKQGGLHKHPKMVGFLFLFDVIMP